MNSIKIYKRYLYISITLLMVYSLAIYIYFIYQAIILDTVPLYSDEYGYSKSLENFLLNHTLASPFTLDEKYSQIGSFSFHGFSYTLFYGTLASILHTDSIMILNILMSVGTLSLILFIIEINTFNKILLITLISTYFVFFLYSYSYMVENIHLLASVTVTYLLYKIFLTHHKKYIATFVIIIFFLSVLRQTWIFYLVALFFLERDKKSLSIYISIFFLGITWVFADISLFHALYPNGFLYILTHNTNNFLEMIITLLTHTKENLIMYFTNYVSLYYYLTKIFIVTLLMYLSYQGIKYKNNFFVGISIVGWVYFFSLLLFYDAFDWREHRSLAVIYISILLALSLYKKHNILYLLLGFHIVFLPSVIEHHQVNRNYLYLAYTSNQTKDIEKIKKFNSISQLVVNNTKKKILIAVDNNFTPMNFNKTLSTLPIQSTNNQIIRYSFSYFNTFDPLQTKASFLLTNKAYPNYNIVEKNKYFTLYRLGGKNK